MFPTSCLSSMKILLNSLLLFFVTDVCVKLLFCSPFSFISVTLLLVFIPLFSLSPSWHWICCFVNSGFQREIGMTTFTTFLSSFSPPFWYQTRFFADSSIKTVATVLYSRLEPANQPQLTKDSYRQLSRVSKLELGTKTMASGLKMLLCPVF
jgi:hypothetical protein